VAAWVTVMFCEIYLVKNYKNAIKSATTEVREKMSAYLESSKIRKILMFVQFDLKTVKFYLINESLIILL
jgi:hypothetical protein